MSWQAESQVQFLGCKMRQTRNQQLSLGEKGYSVKFYTVERKVQCKILFSSLNRALPIDLEELILERIFTILPVFPGSPLQTDDIHQRFPLAIQGNNVAIQQKIPHFRKFWQGPVRGPFFEGRYEVSEKPLMDSCLWLCSFYFSQWKNTRDRGLLE